MGEAHRKKLLGIKPKPPVPDVPLNEAQTIAAQGLIELLQKEEQDAVRRIQLRRMALNRWATDTATELKLSHDEYIFDVRKLAFVDAKAADKKPEDKKQE